MKYENSVWKLINVNDLSIDNRGRIEHKNCVGVTLKYKLKANGTIYKIKIVDYIKGNKNKENKSNNPKFKVEYIYLKGTEFEEIIEKLICCSELINNAKVSETIPSLNQWIKKDNYWVGIDTKGREFKFNSDNKETEYNILHSSWCVGKDNYVITGSLNNTSEQWKLHRAICFNCNKEESDKYIHLCVDHINNNRSDNRMENLRLTTKGENAKNKNTSNKHELVGLKLNGKGYCSQFMFKGCGIYTKTKYSLEEAKLDNLIAQQYLGYKHNEDQFYKIKELSEERIKEVTDLLDKKMESCNYKIEQQKEYSYNYIEKDNLIGIKTLKRDGTPNKICWVDRDFGRVVGDKFIVNGNIRSSKGYFLINNNMLNIYVIIGNKNIHNYRNNNFHIDHINNNPNENYRDNLEIVTIQSNMMNKNGKGYSERKQKYGIKYKIKYGYNWKYFNLYIGGLKTPTFNTEEEAIAEVKRRREIINKYRFRVKTLEELDGVIDFAEEHELDIDSAYIVWVGLDTEDNIKNSLK